MYNIEADLHMHTVNSGHAYSTVDELAKTASFKGLKMIAITEHGPNMPGGPHEYFFGNISILPNELYGVKILKGIEANILDNGKLDISEDRLQSLDFIAAGLHQDTGHNLKTKDDFTHATIEAIKNPMVDMITHPANIYYPVDIEQIVKAARINDVILEVNASSFNPNKASARGNEELTIKLCKLAKRYGVQLSLNSDAHFHTQVGEVHHLYEILNEANITNNEIINTNIGKIEAYLDSHIIRKISV
jgi:putative hydrolase